MNYRDFAIAAQIITSDNPAKVETLQELYELMGYQPSLDEATVLANFDTQLKTVEPKLMSIYPFMLPIQPSDYSVMVVKSPLTEKEQEELNQITAQMQEHLGR